MELPLGLKDYLESTAEGWENMESANVEDANKRYYIAQGIRLAIHLAEVY